MGNKFSCDPPIGPIGSYPMESYNSIFWTVLANFVRNYPSIQP